MEVTWGPPDDGDPFDLMQDEEDDFHYKGFEMVEGYNIAGVIGDAVFRPRGMPSVVTTMSGDNEEGYSWAEWAANVEWCTGERWAYAPETEGEGIKWGTDSEDSEDDDEEEEEYVYDDKLSGRNKNNERQVEIAGEDVGEDEERWEQSAENGWLDFGKTRVLLDQELAGMKPGWAMFRPVGCGDAGSKLIDSGVTLGFRPREGPESWC